MDHYQTLGVEHDASNEQIRSAYRRLVRKHHPDVSGNPGNDASIKAINEAYGVLGDPVKRKAYDRSRNGQVFPDQDIFAGGLHDLFDSIFAGGGRGRDIYRLGLTLDQVFQGGARTVAMGGREMVVNIPPGVDEGDLLEVPGYGGAFFQVAYLPHATFEVYQGQVSGTAEVPPWTLALGGKARVETLGGWVHVNIPPGLKAGQKIRLAGRGMPATSRRQQGDHWARVQVSMPSTTTPEQRQAWQSLAQAFSDPVGQENTAST